MLKVIDAPEARPDWTATARNLAPRFAARAAAADAEDRFVAENIADIKTAGMHAAGVPADLGGDGATVEELADMLREVARACGSTALVLSMHTHQVAIAAWRRLHQNAPVDALLRRVAEDGVMLVSSGGSDWLNGSGTATRIDGGYRIDARKVFSSGAPTGDILMTSAVHADAAGGPEVLHFAVPLKAKEVRILDTWRVMGMRATGSQEIAVEGFFLADSAVAGRRPQGKWHPLFHLISMVALPLIYSVYLGIAEAARDRAVEMAKRRRPDAALIDAVGTVDRHLKSARLAHRHMIEIAMERMPGPETTNDVTTARTLVGKAAIATVEAAMEAAGGAAIFRDNVLERLFRDIQAARYHPLQDKAQLAFAGRMALGLPIDD